MLKKALEQTKKKNLRDVIFKHRDRLGLKGFYLNLMNEVVRG